MVMVCILFHNFRFFVALNFLVDLLGHFVKMISTFPGFLIRIKDHNYFLRLSIPRISKD